MYCNLMLSGTPWDQCLGPAGRSELRMIKEKVKGEISRQDMTSTSHSQMRVRLLVMFDDSS